MRLTADHNELGPEVSSRFLVERGILIWSERDRAQWLMLQLWLFLHLFGSSAVRYLKI